jgi:uncharacterized protein (DUF58 family)
VSILATAIAAAGVGEIQAPGIVPSEGKLAAPEAPPARCLSDRLRDLARRFAGAFPLTVTGALVLTIAGTSFWFLGIERLDLVVLAASALAFMLIALAVLLVALVALFVRQRLRRLQPGPTLTLECDARQPTGFIAPLPHWLPLVEVSWTWLTPPLVDVSMQPTRQGLVELATPSRRARAATVHRRFNVRDVMGLAAISWQRAEAREVRIAPSRGQLDTMALLDGLTGGDDLSEPRGAPHGDRVDMRQYTRGDSPRLILWKVYARTRKLLVRIPERAVTARPRACAYLVTGNGDEASASLARVVVERNLLGDNWRFGADGSLTTAASPAAALELIIASGSATRGTPAGFPEFIAKAARDGFSICLAFLPAGEGGWREGVLAGLGQTGMRVHLLTAVDGGGRRLESNPAWRRVLLRRPARELPGVDDLARMARPFIGLACPFTAVDRIAGRILGDPRRFVAALERAGRPA